MNEKMSPEQQLVEASNGTPACARAEELVSYLYQEASAADAQDFERHLRRCVSCQTELAEFGVVRESIGDWRTQALGGIVNSPATEASRPTVFEPLQGGPTRQRNALAAIREFFTLSPGWMRAATAFAGLVFCALAVIAFTHFFERTEPQTAALATEKPSRQVYTQRQVDEMLARVKQENEVSKQEQLDQQSHKPEVATASPLSKDASIIKDSSARQTVRKSATVASPVMANASPLQRGSNHISTRDRQQLAEVLLPQETKDEERLPRLSDLLENDSN